MAIGTAIWRIHHSAIGGVGTNTWHMRWDGAFDEPGGNIEDCLDVIKQFYEDLAPLQPDSLVTDFDGVVTGNGADEGDTWLALPRTQAGGAAGGVLAPGLCLCCNWKTPTGGRHGRGRTFVGPLAQTVIDANGTPTATAMSTARSAAADLSAASSALISTALVVWSEAEGIARDIGATSVKDQFAMLSSRRD